MHPKLEVVRIRQQYKNQEKLNIAGGEMSTTPAIVKSMKTDIIKSDFEVLLSSAAIHLSPKYVATVAETTSWCRLWDIALDRGVQRTHGMQSLLVVKSLKTFHVDPVVSLWARTQTERSKIIHFWNPNIPRAPYKSAKEEDGRSFKYVFPHVTTKKCPCHVSTDSTPLDTKQ